MTETTAPEFSTPPDYAPPPRSWLSRHSDWLMGSFAAALLIGILAIIDTTVFQGIRNDEAAASVTVVRLILFFLIFGSFVWFALIYAVIYCFAVNPRRRRRGPCGVAEVSITHTPTVTTVRRFPLDDALNAVFLSLIPVWFLSAAAISVYGVVFAEPLTTPVLLVVLVGSSLCVCAIGLRAWHRWRHEDYAIRIDREQGIVFPARRLFSSDVRQPIDVQSIRFVSAERWAARVRPDGRPAPNSCARMSITASVDDLKHDRHVHLLTTTDADRVGHWLAAYLGVPFTKQEFRYGPHRSFRVSKPLPDDNGG